MLQKRRVSVRNFAENMEILVEPQTAQPGCSSAEAVLYTVEAIPRVLQARHTVNN